MSKRHSRDTSCRLATAVSHKALHALQLDLEERYGFDVYRFTESPGMLIAGKEGEGSADLWFFRGVFTASTGFARIYEIHVQIRQADEGIGFDYERLVRAEVLNLNNGGLEYTIQIPKYGEKGSVKIVEVGQIEVPEIEDDILAGLDEVQAKDHLGVEDDSDD